MGRKKESKILIVSSKAGGGGGHGKLGHNIKLVDKRTRMDTRGKNNAEKARCTLDTARQTQCARHTTRVLSSDTVRSILDTAQEQVPGEALEARRPQHQRAGGEEQKEPQLQEAVRLALSCDPRHSAWVWSSRPVGGRSAPADHGSMRHQKRSLRRLLAACVWLTSLSLMKHGSSSLQGPRVVASRAGCTLDGCTSARPRAGGAAASAASRTKSSVSNVM
jgi:hypothetical protein